ncbi:MAG: hypothetical protein KDB14_28195 [Planctomycetales bacterium]|nr:hypothetical protein [Planctomycetales bacterium]
MRIASLAVAMVAALACSAAAVGQEASTEAGGGWRLPNLNPFRRSTEAMPEPSAAAESQGRGPRVPRPSLPSFSRAANSDRAASEPDSGPRFNPFQRIGNGARTFFSSAKNTVTRPFRRGDADAESRPPTFARTASTDKGRGSFFRREAPAPQTSDNVTEFLKLPRE